MKGDFVVKKKLKYLLLCLVFMMMIPKGVLAEEDVISAASLINILAPVKTPSEPSGVKFRSVKFLSKKSKPDVSNSVAPNPSAKTESATAPAQKVKQPSAVLRIYFLSGSDQIADAKSWRQLDEVGKALSSAAMKKCKVEIGGYTDSVGKAEYNKLLSLRRAKAVNKYLFDKFGVSNAKVMGYGESCPVASNRLPEGRKKNRRVVITRLD